MLISGIVLAASHQSKGEYMPPSKPRKSKGTPFWFGQRPSSADGPQFCENTKTDICIIGGGFTGLWTSLQLKTRDPSVDVLVLEADVFGSGASGRNGGVIMSWLHQWDQLSTVFGEQTAQTLADRSVEAAKRVAEFARQSGVETRQGGWLFTSTHADRSPQWQRLAEAQYRAGLEGGTVLSRADVHEGTHLSSLRDGYFEQLAFTTDPGGLTAALVARCRSAGVRLFERSPVTDWSYSGRLKISTPIAEVSAEKMVLCINAYAASQPYFRRRLLPITVEACAIPKEGEQVPDTLRETGIAISISKCQPNYFHVRPDGTLMFGKSGTKVPSRKQLDARSHPITTHGQHLMRRDVEEIFGASLPSPSHSWAGHVARTMSGLPECGYIGEGSPVLYAHGYSGNGLGPSLMIADVLAERLLENTDAEHGSPLFGASRGLLPHPLFRSIGQGLVVAACRRRDRLASQNRRASWPVHALSELSNRIGRNHRRAQHSKGEA